MEENISEDGLKVNNMGKDYLFPQMDRRNKVNGRMV